MPIDRPDVMLPELWAAHGRCRPDKLAVVCAGERESWGALCAGLNRVAHRLRAAGVGRGDNVAVVMSNSIDMLHIMYGIVVAGACVVPISMLLREEQVGTLLADCSAVALFASPGPGALGEASLASLPALRTDLRIGVGLQRAGWLDYHDWIRGAADGTPPVRYSPDDHFSIIYSSGTTGLPKGILHTHRARFHWSYSNALELRFHRDSRALLTTSMYSNGSWFMLLPPMMVGGTVIIMDSFSAASVLRNIASERITHTFMVPTQLASVLADPALEHADLTSLESVLSAGSPLREATKAELRARFTTQLYELYGFSEGFATIIGPPDVFSRPRSVGKPVLGFELRIIDENDRPAVAGEPGEIAGYGAGLMKEYFGKPAATEEAIWRDELGRTFVRSGDIGRLDERGDLQIIDRKKDMILSGGFNIFPNDLEAVVARHPGVIDVAVIGVPHAKWGETPLALVILGPGIEDCDAILAWSNARLGRAQQIRGIEARSEFPRNALGKVLKRVLREPYWKEVS